MSRSLRILLLALLAACGGQEREAADMSPAPHDMPDLAAPDMAAPRFPTGSSCQPPDASTGLPCAESEDCGPHAWCDAGRCAPAAISGQPCSDGVFCAPGLACAFPDTVCGDPPVEGGSCALTRLGPFGCPDSLGCLDGRCLALPGLGQPCTMDSRCAGGLGCDFTAAGSVCAVRRGAGEPCQNDQICAPGAFCDYTLNRCAQILDRGAPCSLGNECGAQGACLPADAAATAFICLPTPTADQPCIDACADGLRCTLDR